MDDFNTKICPVCGKEFEVTYPNLWAYRKKGTGIYYCTWKCIQKSREEKNGMGKLTEEQKQEAIRIAMDGGSPLKYLEECGMANASGTWHNIKKHLTPEVISEIAHKREQTMKNDQKKRKRQELKLEAGADYEVSVAEAPEKQNQKKAIGWEGDFGRYIYDSRQGYIDYESNDGEEISMPVDSWKEWVAEIREMGALMGVKL